ncbi:nuclear transport factor 2 family protein [Spirosoma aerolatum]|uniref:nuclear transport factor 2 family protein n=1 Tax=Spirosoma aerolatum TaxID=1211326 RepID=UPI001FEAC950|nr:nuclear transport factor 2 family protein [Spirosoma aerolatum]
MGKETIHKSIIRDFYRRAVGEGDLAFAEQIIADDYIQHSTTVKPGKPGLLEALAYMKQMPKPPATSAPFMRLIAEGDYVVTNMSFGWAGKQKAVIDLFRFRDGQVVEHWDAMADQPETTLNGHALIDGPLPRETPQSTSQNKTLVTDCMEQIFINRQLEKLSDFVADTLKQHRPEIANGLSGLKTYLQPQPEYQTVEKVLLIIAEGDFVVVQSSGTWQQKPTVFYDVFRLDEGLIVEHWGLK